MKHFKYIKQENPILPKIKTIHIRYVLYGLFLFK